MTADLRSEIAAVLNRYSRENESDTPDHILADYVVGALMAFDRAVNRREAWYGRGDPDARSRCSDSTPGQDVAS